MKSQSTVYIVGPVLSISTWIGFSLGMIGLGIGIYRGEDAGAMALISFGVGVLAGLIVVGPWWVARATSESAKPTVYAKEVRTSGPVELTFPLSGAGNVRGMIVLESVTWDEMSRISAWAIDEKNKYALTQRALSPLIGNRAKQFIDELMGYKCVEWRSYNHDGTPNPNQGVEITDRGRDLFCHYLRSAPYPGVKRD